MKYTILLTDYDPENKLVEMRNECKRRIKEYSEGEDYELIILDRKGAESDVNRGFDLAKGDYIIWIANDFYVNTPDWLRRLAVPGKITSWHIGTELVSGKQMPDGACICIPKDIQKKVGYFDTIFEGNYGWSDCDYMLRAISLGVEFQAVGNIGTHLCAQTFDAYLNNEDKLKGSAINEKIYRDRWNLK